jgi:tocopherol cyclase
MNPDLFHGCTHPDGFFEGWYFRLSFAGRSICLIPGVSVGWDPHAFVMVADSHSRTSRLLRYELSDFSCGMRTLNIRVEESSFSLCAARLNLCQDNFSLTGLLYFDRVRTYPGGCSMGLAAHLPRLECYTQICALDGRVNGQINLGGERIDITDGRLYVEKNWGRSFPKRYTWMQGHLGSGAGFSCSVGRVPVGPGAFEGMIACVYDGERFYEFHTLKGGRHRLELWQDEARLEAISGHYALRLRVWGGHPLTLSAPDGGDMATAVRERLDARAKLVLYDLRSGACLLRQSTEGVGLEVRL